MRSGGGGGGDSTKATMQSLFKGKQIAHSAVVPSKKTYFCPPRFVVPNFQRQSDD